MRAWDNWNSYLDNDGNLLHGKVRFCNRGTTEDIVIYNSDGVAIRNPEFTDMLGRTEYQVFVDNVENVTAYYYKYIGTGDMMSWPGEDYDPTRWSLQYTSDNMDPVSKIDIESNTASGASDMAAFRAVDPAEVPAVDGRKLMWLYGYYAAGDTSPVLYVWDSASQQVDDGGSCIQANDVPGAGRWKLATRELHFDVRHFGVFPTDDINSTDYQYTSQLANCAAYLDKEGLDAWFPALNDNLSYYLFNGTNTFAIKGDIYVSDAVRMHAKTGTTGTIITCKNVHKSTRYLFDSSVQTGKITLNADWIRCSWIGYQCIPNARVGWVIDHDAYPAGITGKEVVFETNGPGQLYLTNCQITSNKKITGTIVIEDCELHTDWFADDYNWNNLSSIGNRILLCNCKDADTYITLKNKQSENTYGDLDGRTISNKNLLENCTLSNATLSSCTLQGNSTLHDVSGTATLSGTYTHEWRDCSITVNGTPTVSTLALTGSTVSGSGKMTVVSSLSCRNTNINKAIDVMGGALSLRNTSINAAILHQAGDTISETIVGCTFNAQVTVKGSGSSARFNQTVWANNVGTVSNPLNLDRSTMNNTELTHTYKYVNNTGTFPSSKSYRYQAYLTCSGTVGDNSFTTGVPKGEPMPWMFIAYTAGETVTHFPNITLFRVGTDDIPLTVRWRMVSFRLNNYNYGTWEITPVDFPLVAKFQSGYTWKPQVVEHAPVTSGDNYYPTYMGIGHFATSASWAGASLAGAFEFCVE